MKNIKIKLRKRRISDAKRFFEILSAENYPSWRRPSSLKDELKFLKKAENKRKKYKLSHSYAIIFENKVIGGCAIRLNFFKQHIGELEYFVDKNYWGKGIATLAVKELEKIGFGKLKLKRIEIRMSTKNCPSEKVAIKAGYLKEGILKKAFCMDGKCIDEFLYAKTK